MGKRQIPPEVYNKDCLLSDYLEGYAEFKTGELSEVKQKQLNMLALEKGTTVLEIGFGRGELLYHCAKKGAVVTGIDYSKDAVEIAKVTLSIFSSEGVDIRLVDCKELPFDDDSFERVVSGDVIEHQDYEDGVLMLKEMYRVLKPGKFMLIHTAPNTIFTRLVYPVAKPFLKLINRDTIKALDEQLNKGTQLHIYEYNLFSLRKIAKEAGLVHAEVWIDEDLLRNSKHRLTKDLSNNSVIKFIASCGKFSLVRFLLGNDLYLKCYK